MTEQAERRAPKIVAAHEQFGDVVRNLRLTQEEAVNAAGEWLCMVILCALAGITSEKEAHETLNSTAEAGHLYINDNWREAVIAYKTTRLGPRTKGDHQ